MVTEVTNKMKFDISKIKDHIIVIGITMVISKAVWYVAKSINTLFKKESSKETKHFADGFHEGRWEDDEDILGI